MEIYRNESELSVTFKKMVGVEEYFFHKKKHFCFEVLSLLRPDTHSRKNENKRSYVAVHERYCLICHLDPEVVVRDSASFS